MTMSLDYAHRLVALAVEIARAQSRRPLAVVVGDDAGRLKAALVEDGAPTARFELALAKVRSVAALGFETDTLTDFAASQPGVFAALQTHLTNPLLPVGGGCAIRDDAGRLIGAIGISGETPENDVALAREVLAKLPA